MGRSRKVETSHSLPIYSAPVPINVRCCSDSDIIIWRSEVTLSAINRHAVVGLCQQSLRQTRFAQAVGELIGVRGVLERKPADVRCVKSIED
jgi:hypothetical protein